MRASVLSHDAPERFRRERYLRRGRHRVRRSPALLLHHAGRRAVHMPDSLRVPAHSRAASSPPAAPARGVRRGDEDGGEESNRSPREEQEPRRRHAGGAARRRSVVGLGFVFIHCVLSSATLATNPNLVEYSNKSIRVHPFVFDSLSASVLVLLNSLSVLCCDSCGACRSFEHV